MSSLDEYMEKLDCADEAERIYAAEDIGYLNTPDGVPALLERLGKETFAGGSRRHFPGPDPDRRGRGYRGFHPAVRQRRSTDSQPGRGCTAAQRRPVHPFPE